MKILLLEDSQERIQHFMRWFDGHLFEVRSTADEAFVLLHEQCFDVVFLDYELGHPLQTGGSFTARWRDNQSRCATQKPTVVLHTNSDWGAYEMQRDLKAMGMAATRLPFRELTGGKIAEILNKG